MLTLSVSCEAGLVHVNGLNFNICHTNKKHLHTVGRLCAAYFRTLAFAIKGIYGLCFDKL
jgi:hypothetical protein